MQAPAWIDRTASDLLDIEAELRALLKSLRHHIDTDAMGPPPGRTRRGRYGPAVTLSANEARTLLRGAMPLPVSATRLRQPHARMLAALHLFSGHLLTLNDPLTDPRHAAGAAAALLTELRSWLAAARWQQACRAAGVRWPLPISAVIQHQTAAIREHAANTLAARAEQHRTNADPAGAQAARTARRRAAAAAAAVQEPPEPAAVLPLRPSPRRRRTA